MPLPNLIHPIRVVVQQIDTAATVYDPDTREPVQQAARKTNVVLPGQPKWVSEESLGIARAGSSPSASGYVLFRMVDLTAAGVTLRLNDRITMQGHLVDEVYIVRLQPLGHYPGQNGASLIRAWFADRLPAKERYS